MKAALFTSFVTAFVAAVVAQTTAPFYVTSPLVGTTYKAGSTATITWTNGVDESAEVSVLTGTSAATMFPTGETFTIKGSDGEYDWKVPTDLPQNATFSFKIDYTDSKGVSGTTYSAGFTITGTTGDVVSKSFVSSASATSAVSSVPATAIVSSSVSAASSAVSSAVSSVTSVIAASSVVPSAVSSLVGTPSASTTPNVSAASGFKAPSVAICAIVLVASTMFF